MQRKLTIEGFENWYFLIRDRKVFVNDEGDFMVGLRTCSIIRRVTICKKLYYVDLNE